MIEKQTLYEKVEDRLDEQQEQLALLSLRVEALERLNHKPFADNLERPVGDPSLKAVRFPHCLRVIAAEELVRLEGDGTAQHTRERR